MSRRNTKKQVSEVKEVEEVSEIEVPADEVDEVDEVREIERQNDLKVCISCGSTSNLFKSKIHKTCIECLNLRPKKSEKQLEAFKLAREKRMVNVNRRKSEIAELEKQAKEELDKKIVSKAISIKKKLIKQTAELDAVSDDDTPLEEVMKIAKKKPTRPIPLGVGGTTRVQNKKSTISEPEQIHPVEQRSTQQYVPQIRTFNFL